MKTCVCVFVLSKLLQVHRTLCNKCFLLTVNAFVTSVILLQTLAEDGGRRLL
jgi:hypothetical protein